MQDTDVAPFDTGAYASRQTYVSGMALKKTAGIFREKILSYASEMLELPADALDISDSRIVAHESGETLLTMQALAMEAFYSLTHSVHITAEATNHCKDNTFAFGVCFAEVEVDIPVILLKIERHSGKLLRDSGKERESGKIRTVRAVSI